MFRLIESILLSQVLIFMVMSVMLLVVTVWAFRQREYAGYLLGWLVGIFFVIVYQTVTGGDASPAEVEALEEAVEQPELRLSLLAVMVPSIIGLVAGFSLLLLLRTFSSTQAKRAVTIAVLTATVLIMMYFLAITSEATARIFGIFALAFAIGTLINIVLGGPTLRGPQRPPPGDGLPSAQIDATQERFDRLRRRIDRRQ
jgi:hypothetical protein